MSMAEKPAGVEKDFAVRPDSAHGRGLATEWERIEKGLKQRIRALNLFIDDLYHDRKDYQGRGSFRRRLFPRPRGFAANVWA